MAAQYRITNITTNPGQQVPILLKQPDGSITTEPLRKGGVKLITSAQMNVGLQKQAEKKLIKIERLGGAN